MNRPRIVGAIAIVDALLDATCRQNRLADYRSDDPVQKFPQDVLESIHSTKFWCESAISGIHQRLLANKENGSGGCTSIDFIQETLQLLESLGLVEREWREYKGPVFDEQGTAHWEPPAQFKNVDIIGLCQLFQTLWRTRIERETMIEDDKLSINRTRRNNALRAPTVPLPDHHHWWAQKFVEATLGISINAKSEDLQDASPSPARSHQILSGKINRLQNRLSALVSLREQLDRFGEVVERSVLWQIAWIEGVLRKYNAVCFVGTG
jgi:hypothetical protein